MSLNLPFIFIESSVDFDATSYDDNVSSAGDWVKYWRAKLSLRSVKIPADMALDGHYLPLSAIGDAAVLSRDAVVCGPSS